MQYNDQLSTSQNTWNDYIENPDIYQQLLQNLKVDVNNFLYTRVHSDMTIKQFETLSITIYRLILQKYQSHLKPSIPITFVKRDGVV